jgi:hypothetical protein
MIGAYMTIDFQQVLGQIRQFGEQAVVHEQQLINLRQLASQALAEHTAEIELIKEKINKLSLEQRNQLRCAVPRDEPLTTHNPIPSLSDLGTIIAADGSQIFPDHHVEIFYGLINVGAIIIHPLSNESPTTLIQSQLIYDNRLENLSNNILALYRDIAERQILVKVAKSQLPPVITFTDGPMELWISRESSNEEKSIYQKAVSEYQESLHQLNDMQIITSGYVDKPGANLVVRMLEITLADKNQLLDLSRYQPFKGVLDTDLFGSLLASGERSAIFSIQSASTVFYQGNLSLNFFYVNVSDNNQPWLARIEVPAWVAKEKVSIDRLHLALINQCRLMSDKPYPYLLHRAHETAVVTQPEREQLNQMILIEMRKQGFPTGKISAKHAANNLPARKKILS